MTTLIALLAVIIALAQWATHHRTMVLELFEKRLKTYRALREVLSEIKGKGQATIKDVTAFRDGMDEAEFLFGNGVMSRLKEALDAILDLETYGEERRDLDTTQNRERADAVAKERRAKNVIENIHKTFPSLFVPYMRMAQKTPWWWFENLIPQRKSSGNT